MCLEKPQKSYFFNGRAIKALPPPSSLMAVGFFFFFKVQSLNLFLMAGPLPHPLLNGTDIKKRTFSVIRCKWSKIISLQSIFVNDKYCIVMKNYVRFLCSIQFATIYCPYITVGTIYFPRFSPILIQKGSREFYFLADSPLRGGGGKVR